MTLEVHLGFEPDAERARRIDRRMHTELAASLRYVVEQASGELPFDEHAVLKLAAELEGGARVSAEVFAWYYDLVAALVDADLQQSMRLLSNIERAQPVANRLEFMRLKAPADCRRSALYLYKFLEDAAELSVTVPPAEVAERFVGRFDRGMSLLRAAAPELAGEVDAIVHEVVPVSGDRTRPMQIDGGSHYQLWGALFLNTDYHPTDDAMVEVIAHESAHSLLFGLCTHEPLVLNDDSASYPSPLRVDPRPMDGIYHATFVSARMHWVMTRLLESGSLDPARRADVEAARASDARNFKAGLSVIHAHGELTSLGEALMANAERYMAHA